VTTAPVFLVESLPAGERAVLDGPEGHHASAVRRLRAGEELMLCDGKGSVAACVVESAGRDSLDLRVRRRWAEPAPRPRLVVAQALIKGDRGELAVELATEAGADAIVPWRAARSVVRWESGPRGDRALARWRSTAREAAKQSRRAWVPEVWEPVTTAGLVDLVRGAAGALLTDGSAATPIAEAALPNEGDLVVIVGPEGGTTDEEIALLETAGAQGVRLGNTVLRASTAAAVAVCVLGVLTRRWR
jgi:16S rRNA (uracil1498-N3)-methyltransferase